MDNQTPEVPPAPPVPVAPPAAPEVPPPAPPAPVAAPAPAPRRNPAMRDRKAPPAPPAPVVPTVDADGEPVTLNTDGFAPGQDVTPEQHDAYLRQQQAEAAKKRAAGNAAQ